MKAKDKKIELLREVGDMKDSQLCQLMKEVEPLRISHKNAEIKIADLEQRLKAKTEDCRNQEELNPQNCMSQITSDYSFDKAKNMKSTDFTEDFESLRQDLEKKTESERLLLKELEHCQKKLEKSEHELRSLSEYIKSELNLYKSRSQKIKEELLRIRKENTELKSQLEQRSVDKSRELERTREIENEKQMDDRFCLPFKKEELGDSSFKSESSFTDRLESQDGEIKGLRESLTVLKGQFEKERKAMLLENEKLRKKMTELGIPVSPQKEKKDEQGPKRRQLTGYAKPSSQLCADERLRLDLRSVNKINPRGGVTKQSQVPTSKDSVSEGDQSSNSESFIKNNRQSVTKDNRRISAMSDDNLSDSFCHNMLCEYLDIKAD